MTDVGQLYYADCRIDVRVYFTDNGDDDLTSQAVDALEDWGVIPDDPGDCEHNGTEVLRVEKARP